MKLSTEVTLGVNEVANAVVGINFKAVACFA